MCNLILHVILYNFKYFHFFSIASCIADTKIHTKCQVQWRQVRQVENSNKTRSGIVDCRDHSAESNTAEPPGWSITQDDWGYEGVCIFVCVCPDMFTCVCKLYSSSPLLKGLHQQANRIINFSRSLECLHFIFICLFSLFSTPTFTR